MRPAVPLLLALLLIGLGAYFQIVWPMRDPHPALECPQGTLAIRDVRIYTAPDAQAIEHGTVLARAGRIAEVGESVAIPPDAVVLNCDGCTVTAGFWNSHVHFTESKWDNSAFKTSAELNAQLADMLTSRGFTTVTDLGSDFRQSISLRRRIETGNLKGPKIYTSGADLYPPHGIPYYLGDLPFFIRWLMAQPATPEAAAQIEERNITRGADVLKLFTGSIVKPGTVLPMPLDVARAAVEVAHRHGQIAFAHPSNLAGTKVAIDSGVDVLAHAPSDARGVSTAVLQAAIDRHMSMMPTLKMFATTVTPDPKFLHPIYDEVREFKALGGDLMFGTDVGYMADYSTEGEFSALAESGLSSRDILRMLTVAPAARFGVTAEKGTIEPGKLADLVVVDGDPVADVGAFSRVRYTIRTGRVIYARGR